MAGDDHIEGVASSESSSPRPTRRPQRSHDNSAPPQMPKYKSLDKLSSDSPTPDEDGQREPRHSAMDREPDMRMCTIVPRNKLAAAMPYNPELAFIAAGMPAYQIQLGRFVEGIVKPSLFHLAKTAATRKITFLALPILLILLALVGPFYYRDQLAIHVPFPSFVSGPDPTVGFKGLRTSFNAHPFNSSNPEFDALRRTSSAEFGLLLATRNPFVNIIANSTLNSFSHLRHLIQNISVPHSYMSLMWDDVCRESCSTDNALIRSLRRGQATLKFPDAIIVDDKGRQRRYSLANVFGGVDVDTENQVTKANTIQMNIKLKDTLKSETYDNFEKRLRGLAQDRFHDKEVRVFYWSMYNYVREVVQMLTAAHYRLIPCALLLLALCVCVSVRMDSYRTRPFVGLQVGCILILCCGVGYAVQVAGAGQPNAMVFPAVFVVAASGALLFFSLTQTWNRYSLAALHPAEKLAFILSWDGPCAMLALLCVIVGSIAVAVLAPLTMIQAAFFIVAAGLAAVLIFTLFYMNVCWFLSGRREAEGLKWWQIGKTGDKQFNDKTVVDYDQNTAAVLHEKMADLKPSFSRSVGKFVASSGFRTLSLTAVIIYLVFAGLGLQRIRVQMKEEDFVQTNSTSAQYLHKFHEAFRNYDDYVEVVFDAPIDYYDKVRRAEALDLLRQPQDTGHVNKVVSWLLDFERFQHNSIYDINPDTIVPVVNYVFLTMDHFHKFSTDIVFDKHKTQIVKSRSYLELSDKGVQERQKVIQNLLELAERYDLPVTVRTPMSFSLHHDVQILNRFIVAYITELLTMTALSFFLIIQPSISLALLLSCAGVTFGVVGYSAHLGIPLNAPTLTTLLLGNVYAAVVTIHFCYQFVNTGPRQQTSLSRVMYAYQCGLAPTLFSGLVLGLFFFPIPLAVDAPVLLHIWKVLAAVALLSFLSMVCLLPGLMIILTEWIVQCFARFQRICDRNGFGSSERPSESIYFVPGQRPLKMVGYGGGVLALDPDTRRMLLAGGRVTQPPPDYAISAGNMFVAGADGYPRRAERYRIREAESETESRPASTRMSQNRDSSRYQTPIHERRHRVMESGEGLEEQIYEEPESPIPSRLHHSPAARFNHAYVRDAQAFRVDYAESELPPIRPQWRQYSMDPRAFQVPYVHSPSGARRY